MCYLRKDKECYWNPGECLEWKTSHYIRIFCPDKDAAQIIPQKVTQIWLRGQHDVPHRQVLAPDRDPGGRGGTTHVVGVQTLHQGQLGRVFQHRCSGKIHPVNWTLSPLSLFPPCVSLPFSVSHPLFLPCLVQQSGTHPLR